MQLSSFRQHVIIFAKAAVVSFLAGCSSPISEIEQPTDTTPRMVGITTRSTADISYPMTLYAFYSRSGALAGTTTAFSADDILTLPLRLGSYHLVAMAGTEGLEKVTSPTADQSIGVPERGYINSAIQMGGVDITVEDKDISADLEMSYQVAQIDIELYDIPTDITAVNVSLSSLYSDMTFRGNLSGEQTISIPLEKVEGEDDTWKSNTIYTLKGSSTQLTLSISMTNETSTKTYGYTHTNNLEAGTPYTFIGSYIEGFYLTGAVTSKGWNKPQNINFTFGIGAGANEDNGDNEEDNGENDENEGNNDNTNNSQGTKDDDQPDDTDASYWVSTIPEAISIWNGHFVGVATKSSDNTSAELLLISLQEWEKTTAEAITVQNEYTESHLGNWRIPTAAEMTTIASWGKTENMNTLDRANGKLTNEGGGTKLTNGAYYLCDDGAKIVKFSESKASNAASDVTYRLRLVRTITVKIPQE